MYERILKPILFRLNPERVHDFFVSVGHMLGAYSLTRGLVSWICVFPHPSLRTQVAGIDFANPVGLAAGFDKDVNLTNIMSAVGFGFMEVGAVTRFPYEGNSGRRLLRLPADKSLIVYYGLKNIGAEAILKKLPRLKFTIPTGINIAKTNRADIMGEKSIEDYIATYRLLGQYFAYTTLNISCPNTQDGCTFQDPLKLDQLLAALSKEPKVGPMFLKISNHLTTHEVDQILAVVEKYSFVDGFVVGNLSKRRETLNLKSAKERSDMLPQGGISGQPVREQSTNLIRHMYRRAPGKYVIIGLGGIFNAQQAYEKIKAGANLVQIITGLIFGGPLTVKRINQGLVKLLQQDGFSHISEAVGKELS